ncbi:MAG: LamG-like jellyroll fold domain-containing protein [Planctomycetota bacterium]|jgi:hypothetical protein
MSKKLICLVSFVLVLGLVLPSVAHAGLVGWWRFEEGSGDTANDSSGNGHHGTLLGTSEWVLGPEGFGGALAFNPDRCIGVDCGIFDPTSGMGQFTVALWAFWDGTTTTTVQHFLTKSNGWGADIMMFQFELWAASTNTDFTDRVGVSYEPVGSVPFSIMPKNEWVHLAVTFDGSNAVIYLNGVDEVGPKPFSIGPNINAMVEIGYNSNRATVNERTFHGTLDEFRIYDRMLTENEIQVLMIGGEVLSLAAYLPGPANQATEVRRDAVLSWMAGDRADKHNVYFGTVFDDVNEASIADPRGVLVSENQDETIYVPASLLEFGQTYYWRVDEVNAPPDSAAYKGNVWSFTIVNFIVVDDFEDYNDFSPNIIYETWIDGWENPENGSTVGHPAPDFLQGEHYAETTIVHGGKQSMPLFYDNSGTATNSEAQRTFSPGQDWTRESVDSLSLWFKGYPAYVGGFVEAPAGTYTMTATGTDIWSTDDEFHFAYKELSGAGAIIAKVESVENTDPWAKAGVMIRDTLESDSANIALLVTPENGVRFQYRKTAGGITDRYFVEGITAPQWVKLERTVGGLARAFYSADGSTWTMLNMTVVSMNMPVYIGLAVTSHNVDATCEAKFSNVSFPDTSVGPQWTDQDVGMMSNAAEPIYVILNGSAVVYHEDTGAAQIETWTKWNIGLQGFADQGLDLTNVNTIGIGFGDRSNPQTGGTGTMYFDDIRLYRPAPQPESN